MSSKHVTSDRKRSRPVKKQSKIKNLKRNKFGMFFVVVVILMVVFSGFYVVFMSSNPNNNMSSNSNNNSSSNVNQSNPIAIINTTMGEIKVELYKDKMPKTCENFIKLANDGFYNGLVFHRVIKGFVIQSGGYYPNGTYKPSPYGNIEFESSDITHVDGAISMASTGAGVGGSSQFFICDGAQHGLDGNYAAFGKVIEGMDVVRAIASVDPTTKFGMQDWPVKDVIINSITIEYEEGR